jgi:hypothetical protein
MSLEVSKGDLSIGLGESLPIEATLVMNNEIRKTPLHSSEFRHEHESGRCIIVRENVRGLLKDTEVRVEQPEIVSPDRFVLPYRTAIEALCEELRAVLDKADLPTDRYPIIPFELDYGYEPLEHTEVRHG